MKENFIHFIWKYGLFHIHELHTTQGEKVTIIHKGNHNSNQGADFQDCKIQIGDQIMVGNVEIHIQNNQWYEHGHHKDKQYNNTILHVVFENTLEQYVLTEEKTSIPILCLKAHIDFKKIERYGFIESADSKIPCASIAKKPNRIEWERFKSKLIAERLTRKSTEIKKVLIQNKNDWETTFYWFLCSSFGLKVNREVFFEIAKSIPHRILAKHKNNLLQIEALFLGQANLIESKDQYSIELNREYQHLTKMYSITPLKASPYFLRMRPSSFPTLRLSQFAHLVSQSNHLFSKIIHCNSIKEIKSLLESRSSEYWDYHYQIGVPTTKKMIKELGNTSIDIIIINTVIPFVFLYETEHHGEMEKTISLLQQIKKEKNATLELMDNLLKINNSNAFDTQAHLELFNSYCQNKKCLDCSIGFESLK